MELKDLGGTIDALYELRQKRLDVEKLVKNLKSEEMTLRNALTDMLQSVGLDKASGHIATVGIKEAIIPVVADWEQTHEFIRTNDRFDLLQKRISVLAWRELYESGQLVPGTEAVVDIDLSLTKSSRS